MPCTLDYIPARLHWFSQDLIVEFSVGDVLYRRCNLDEIENPFCSLSLCELSHNIGTNNGTQISEEGDVLFYIIPSEQNEKYNDKISCALEIRNLDVNNIYRKEFHQVKGEDHFLGILQLIHDPVECMYPHCIFRIFLNNEIVTYKNYSETLKKVNHIRTSIREELAFMVKRRIIQQYPSQDIN